MESFQHGLSILPVKQAENPARYYYEARIKTVVRLHDEILSLAWNSTRAEISARLEKAGLKLSVVVM